MAGDAVVVLLFVSRVAIYTRLKNVYRYVFHLNTMCFKHGWVHIDMNFYVFKLPSGNLT